MPIEIAETAMRPYQPYRHEKKEAPRFGGPRGGEEGKKNGNGWGTTPAEG